MRGLLDSLVGGFWQAALRRLRVQLHAHFELGLFWAVMASASRRPHLI